MIRFSAEVEGVPQINRAFNRLDRQISDFRNIWPEPTRVIYGIFHKAFETEGASTSAGKWKELSPAYAKRKAIQFPGQPILRAENSLFESLTDPDAPDAIYRPERDQLIIGTKDPKGRAHQRGGGRLPARPIIAFTEQDRRALTKSIQAGLAQFVRGLGFQVDERAA